MIKTALKVKYIQQERYKEEKEIANCNDADQKLSISKDQHKVVV